MTTSPMSILLSLTVKRQEIPDIGDCQSIELDQRLDGEPHYADLESRSTKLNHPGLASDC